jgi:hypothetical protein
MKHLLRVTILSFVMFLPLSIMAFQNEPNGFRGFKWGTELSKLKNIELIEDGKSGNFVNVYRIKNDELKIGDAKLEYIKYYEWNGKLYEVWILAKGNDNVENLLAACVRQFGPLRAWEFSDEYTSSLLNTWRGKTTTVILRRDSETGTLILRSREIEDLIQKERKQKQEELKEKGEKVKGF